MTDGTDYGSTGAAEGGRSLSARPPVALTGHFAGGEWGAWATLADGPVLATSDNDGTVLLWRPDHPDSPPLLLTGHTKPVSWGAWAMLADGPALATGDDAGTVLVWRPDQRGTASVTVTNRTSAFSWGAWATLADGPALATSDLEEATLLWRPDRPDAALNTLGGEGPGLWGAWVETSDGPILATSDLSRTVWLWRPDHPDSPPTRLASYGRGAGASDASGPSSSGTSGLGHIAHWGAWATLADGPVLATGDWDGAVLLWRPDHPNNPPTRLFGHTEPATWGVWATLADGPVLATGDWKGTVLLWRPDQPDTPPTSLISPTGDVWWGAWATVDGNPVLATGCWDGTVLLWQPDHPETPPIALIGHTRAVSWGAWATLADGPVLATGDAGGRVLLWAIVEERPIERLPGYQSDVAAGRDELARSTDAKAVAELVTARSVLPPLAVGLFGDWGEGKSHFLDLLYAKVTEVAGPSNSLAHDHVRQVRFNAWHFAETDLWASLVGEMFGQVALPPDDAAAVARGGDAGVGAEQRRQGRLAAELIEKRQLRERLDGATARLAALQSAQRTSTKMGSDVSAELNAAAEQVTPALTRQAVGIYLAIRGSRSRLQQELQRARAIWANLSRLAKFLAVGGPMLVLVAVVAYFTLDLESMISAELQRVGVTTGAVTLLAAFSVAGKSWVQVRQLWALTIKVAERERSRFQTAIDVQFAQIAQLNREIQNLTTAGQLAGFVADSAAAGSYRERLGVMTQIREDFQQMAQLLVPDRGDARPEVVDAADDTLPKIDRIILYIDDLDRCPPNRVVEMLEAIHLLLAVKLFVVVVAVDPRWLLRAIAVHYRDMLQVEPLPEDLGASRLAVDPDDEELWRSTPANYLEKIFQVVLTLPPLDEPGYQQLLTTLVNVRSDRAADPVLHPAGEAPSSASMPSTPSSGSTPVNDAQDWASLLPARPGEPVPLPTPPVVERVDPLALEPDELSLLTLLGPPLLVTTPRGVKRLANSYGLLTALRENQRNSDGKSRDGTVVDPDGTRRSVEYIPYRAAVVLLGALVAYPALGPALFLHLHHTAATSPQRSWQEFLTDLDPRHSARSGWRNAADPEMTRVQAQQWQALLKGLRVVAVRADAVGLALPEPLEAWAEWIVPVGRLSFPTGRIVSSLDRLQPLHGGDASPGDPLGSGAPHAGEY